MKTADQVALNSISIVVPARNEEATIGEVVERSFRAFAEMGREGEVLVVNDGSTDNTAHCARLNCPSSTPVCVC